MGRCFYSSLDYGLLSMIHCLSGQQLLVQSLRATQNLPAAVATTARTHFAYPPTNGETEIAWMVD